ncbi:MAG: glutamate formimidoyltransferase [Pyrinomonadaceae bacterium]
MMRIVECVPNFSEGRKTSTIESIAQSIEQVPNSHVINIHMDADHNRSVITFFSCPDNIVEASVRAVARAAELIDLRHHSGAHPRIGATDVLPLIPIRGVTIDDCVNFAHESGRRISNELAIPVFFYERAALRPDRKRLEDIRRGGLEHLKQAITGEKYFQPDAGPLHLHETAGASVIGARWFLIAFNVNLKSTQIEIAKKIAGTIRERGGGLPSLKALGIDLKSKNKVQVSMNLTDYRVTSLKDAFDFVRRETEKYGIEIAESEIVGVVPEAALFKGAEKYLKIKNFNKNLILEHQIMKVLSAKC